ncbi:MAG TPA: phosphate acyltransferase PlsX [Acholeplasmataceae bacterium]|nr:phosphate acyltransferase PlsX [Acholeplasmataceae bacterium]
MIKLAIDAMGGDFAPKEIVKGVNIALKQFSDLELVLFGDENEIKKYLEANDRVKIVHAESKLDMGEKDPVRAIRTNKELSIVKAFKSVADGECSGAVTAGPTQGVIVASHLIIRRIKGMKRVALCPELPMFAGKKRLLLDVGANTEIKSLHMLQQAQFASIYASKVLGVEKPLVGLLNIGTEPGKGRELDLEVYELLTQDPNINFYGNVEPKELLTTECDILITDGFSGNLVMKTMEGTAKALGMALKEEISKTLGGKIGYLFMKKNLANFKNRLNPNEIGGAVIFGVDGVVVKAHGSSNAYAFSQAIKQARLAVKGDIINKMKENLVLDNE